MSKTFVSCDDNLMKVLQIYFCLYERLRKFLTYCFIINAEFFFKTVAYRELQG